MKVVVSWSGGKDSQASLIWAVRKYGANNVQAVFCDTGWEHELTLKHVREVCSLLFVELIILRSKKYEGFVDLAKKRGRFPSTKARFCTQELKVIPFIDWILDHFEDRIIIQGIRAEESTSRAEMDAACTYFKYYFIPYDDNNKKLTRLLNKKEAKSSDLRKIEALRIKIALGKLEPKYMTYRKTEVFEYVKKWTTDIWRPVFDWTGVQVITYILDNGQKPNPLYYMGFSRVGCFPCIMCRLKEILLISKNQSSYIARLEQAEIEVGRTFFAPNYIPRRAATIVDPSTGKKIPSISDVTKYVSRNENQVRLFPETIDTRSCMSAFNICE